MKKKSKKYVKGSVFAALLLASISVRTVVGADNVIGMDKNMVVEDDKTLEQEDITEDFTDPDFRAAVRNVLGLNDDEPITKSACADVTSLDVSGKDIQNLNGIGYFTNLTFLYCYNNQLTSLDLSNCTSLGVLGCAGNQLTSLDVSGCTSLSELYCYDNKLTSLDVSDCTNLSKFECYSNQLTSLDVSGCTNLSYLHCDSNKLTSLDVSGCTSLLKLYCYGNKLTSLNVSGCTSLSIFECRTNKLTSLDVSGCTSLSYLYCSENKLTSLDISGCTSLSELHCSENKLTSLDMSGCTSLLKLYCSGSELTSLDVSGCTSLSYLSCYSNQLTSLYVSGCINLSELYCYDNQLTSLDVSGCTSLSYLSCYSNQLTSLYVSGCTSLSYLPCYGNQLTSLDVSDCTSLSYLYCSENELISLDVSDCTDLSYLSCYSNQLTSLDVSDCTSLSYLSCYSNSMKSPNDVKGITKEFNKENFIFYPQNNATDVPTVPTTEPTRVPTQTPTAEPTKVPTQTPTAVPTKVPTHIPSIKPTDKPETTPSDESTKGFKKKYNLSDLFGYYDRTQLNIQIPKSGRLRLVFDECEDPDFYISCKYESTFGKYIPFMITNKEETAYTNWGAVLPGTITFYISSETSINTEATLCVEYQPEDTYIGEVEPNDSFDTANKIPLNTTFWGSGSSQNDAADGPDMDYFSFNVDSPSKMKITTKDLNHAAIRLYKERKYGNVEYITTALYYIEYFFPVIRLSPGKYFLEINSGNIEDYDYSIYINLKKESDESYEQEDNDLSSKANKKKINKWYTGNINIYSTGINEYAYDRDWYQFKISKKSYIEMGLRTPRQAEDSVIANLYDPSKKSIASIVSTENPYSKTKRILVNPGTYYIRVNCNDSSLGFTNVNWDYQIRLSQKSISKKVQSPRVVRKSLRLYAGGKTTPLKVSKAKGKITYKSQNPNVARVTAKGKVIPKKAGKTTIIIKASGNSIYKPATIKVSVTVKKR